MAGKTMIAIGKTRYCRCCRSKTIHNHGGVQEYPHKVYDLWNCIVCGDTSATFKMTADEWREQLIEDGYDDLGPIADSYEQARY